MKDEDLGLSAQPHVSSVIKVSGSANGLIIIASDGLWDVSDPDLAVKVLTSFG